jgi:hypothetical protein
MHCGKCRVKVVKVQCGKWFICCFNFEPKTETQVNNKGGIALYIQEIGVRTLAIALIHLKSEISSQ